MHPSILRRQSQNRVTEMPVASDGPRVISGHMEKAGTGREVVREGSKWVLRPSRGHRSDVD
jgi:hypothetical protein